MVTLKSIVRHANVGSILGKVELLAKKQVLVGVPAENSPRQGDADKINNAELLYILSNGVRQKAMREEMQENLDNGMKYSEAHSLYMQEHGSPLWHVPPRPVLEPAIEANKEPIAKQLQAAAMAALHDDQEGATAHLEKAGMMGERAARKWFDDPRNNWEPNSPKTIDKKGSDHPMVDTNEMRKSITYVLRDR